MHITLTIIIIIIITIIIIIINNNNNNKYWVDVRLGIVSSHGDRDPLSPCLAILLEMVSR